MFPNCDDFAQMFSARFAAAANMNLRDLLTLFPLNDAFWDPFSAYYQPLADALDGGASVVGDFIAPPTEDEIRAIWLDCRDAYAASLQWHAIGRCIVHYSESDILMVSDIVDFLGSCLIRFMIDSLDPAVDHQQFMRNLYELENSSIRLRRLREANEPDKTLLTKARNAQTAAEGKVLSVLMEEYSKGENAMFGALGSDRERFLFLSEVGTIKNRLDVGELTPP